MSATLLERRDLEVRRRLEPVSGVADLTGVRRSFDALRDVTSATLLVGRCLPTAAFSRGDALLPSIGTARAVAAEQGFEPVTRHVGGHLAAYDEGSLVVHVWSPHDTPGRDLQRRFIVLSYALRDAIEQLGVAGCRVGRVPGEYCEGAWSINIDGTAKVAGTGQRISKYGWMWSAVVAVESAPRVRTVLTECYRELGLSLFPGSVGSLSDRSAGLTVASSVDAIISAISTSAGEHRLFG